MSLHLRIADGGAGHDDVLSSLIATDDFHARLGRALRPPPFGALEYALQIAYGDDFDVDDEDDLDDEFESEFEDDYDEEDLDDLEDAEGVVDYEDEFDDIDDDY